MKKIGDERDLNRRQEHVEQLQDSTEWKKYRKLPRANATWPTALIIVPSSVVHNWERELHTWGYFEVGIYAGTAKEREPLLRDFQLGRLDVGLFAA
jgi:SNF2 family DNA or RNA helicase